MILLYLEQRKIETKTKKRERERKREKVKSKTANLVSGFLYLYRKIFKFKKAHNYETNTFHTNLKFI